MDDDMDNDPGTSRDDSEIGLPKSAQCDSTQRHWLPSCAVAVAGTVNKMFKEMLGPELRCTAEAHGLLHSCLNGASTVPLGSPSDHTAQAGHHPLLVSQSSCRY